MEKVPSGYCLFPEMPDWCDKYRVILAFMVVLFLPSLGSAQIILKPFEARYKTEQPGGIVYVSNNILSCNGCNATNQMPPNGTSDNNDFSSKYIDIDGLPETFSSSSADLRLPDCSTITFAGLYWGGAARNNNPRLSQKNQVKLKLPGASNYMDLVADVDFGLFEDQHYQYFKDVTGLVTKNLVSNGTFMVGNVVANEGSAGVEAGWTLVIVYRQDREPVRNLTVFDGFVGIPTDAPDLEIPLNGFLTPPAGPVSYELGFVAYEGDRGLTGDYMQFNKQNIKDATHASTNTFNSSITRNGSVVTTRNPAHNNTLGYDASILSPDNSTYKYLGNSATSATITMATNADRYAVGVVSTAIDVYNPYFQFTHQYTNLSGTPQVSPGDEVVFEYELSNIGIDQSTNTVFIDSLPAAFQYVPGSLEVQYNGNWTRKTDASQDDDAEFILPGNRVVFRLGTGASATQGGVVGPNTVIKVRYHARLTSDCDLLRCTGSNISKFGQLNYSGNINKENSWQVQSTPQLEAGACATAGPLSIDLDIPLECQAVPENKSFTVDCETDVSMFGLPSGYSLYASSDTGFNTPLSKVSVSGDYIARRVVSSGCEYSFNVQVTVNTVKILKQPVSVTACIDENIKFSVSALGTGNFFKWQSSENGTTWTDIGGATDSTLMVRVTDVEQNGTRYRVIVNRSCGPSEISQEATLSITPAVKIVRDLQSVDVCEGADTALTVEASGANISYQWQILSGSTWSNILGENDATLALTGVTAGQSGTKYRALINSTCGTLTSAEATLTVSRNLIITTQPQPLTVCEGSDATFTVDAKGDNLSYQWQTNGGGAWTDIHGATGSTLNLSTIAAGQSGTKYRAVINSTCGAQTSAEATLTVTPKLTITTQPQPLTVCEGSNATFTVGATGDNLRYQWQTNGGGTWTDISGATGSTLNLTSVAAGQMGAKYRAVINSTCGTLTSAEATLTVTPKLTITTQPQPVTVCEGSNATFTVGATGDNLSYQWQTNGGGAWLDINGATTSTLTLSSTTSVQNGSKYRAVITSTCGTLTSAEATLTVTTKLTITTQPQPLTVCEGSNATFTVGATGDNLSYQWQTNGGGAWTDISDATGSTFNLTSVAAGQSGAKYRAVINSTCGTLTSAEATLTVTPKLIITTQPQPLTVCEGSNVTFTVGATGDNLSYQWQTNGGGAWAEISGATGSTLNLSTIAAGQSGTKYRAVINSTCGALTSAEATLTVIPKLTITTEPQPLTVCEGSNATFTVGATGDNLTYQWQTNGGGVWSDISGATGSTLNLSSVAAGQSGTKYRAVINSTCGTLTSAEATLTVSRNLIITTQPQPLTVCEGSNTTFTVVATGDNLSYQWQTNVGGVWTDINGAIGSTLNLTSVIAGQSGAKYRAVINSTCGTLTSAEAALIVTPKLSITIQPQPLTVCEESNATFTVVATGDNLSYQWQMNGGGVWSDISGATTSTLSLSSTLVQNGIKYRAVITSTCGTLTSAEAALTVTPKLTITTQPQPLTVCEGTNATFTLSATGDNISYQWQTNGGGVWTDISGATGPTLNLSPIAAGLSGTKYRAVINSTCGTLTSAEAALTVTPKLSITTQPQQVTVCEGSNATFTVGSTGDNLSYQWQTSGGGVWTDISGATGSTLNLTSVTAGQKGTKYRAVIKSTCGTSTSAEATLTVTRAISITGQPKPVTLCEGSSATFTVGVSGDNATYQWQTNNGGTSWSNITAATGSSFTVKAVSRTQNGYQYRVVVKNECGIQTSVPAAITVNNKPIISKQPASVTICEGTEAIFAVEASGNQITYQWQKNDGESSWTNIQGATGPSLTVKALGDQNGYYYRVVVSGACGTVTSEKVFTWAKTDCALPVSEEMKPRITAQPQSLALCVGDPASLSVQASGENIKYQWQSLTGDSWVDMPNETGAALNFPSVTSALNGRRYRVQVYNQQETLTSAEAMLEVNSVPKAQDDEFNGAKGSTLTGSVGENDSDPDQDPLTFTTITPPQHGTWLLDKDGSFTFQPEKDWTGSTTAVYSVSDGKCLTQAEVVFTVLPNLMPPVSNDDSAPDVIQPAARDDVFQTDMEKPVSSSVALNDAIDQIDHPVFTTTSTPINGTLTFSADGSFVYTPNKGFSGVDRFTYQVCSPKGLCSSAKVEIKVIPSTIVNLTPGLSTVHEGGKVSVTATLERPFDEDITIRLSYKGKAIKGSDYHLSDQFETIRIPKGHVTTYDQVTLFATVDNQTEEAEDVIIDITSTSNANVRIGTGALVLITNSQSAPPVVSNPADLDIPEGNGIQPQPLVSPNGDNNNDYFQIKNIDSYPNNEVVIFNRWGNEVFRVKGYNEGNGNVFRGLANRGIQIGNNDNLPDGVYYYIVTPDITKVQASADLHKGYLILKRN